MLSRELIDLMRDLYVFPVVISSVSNDLKPYSAMISWVYPVSESKLNIALSTKSRTAQNIITNPNVCVSIFAQDIAIVAHGKGYLKNKIEEVPFDVSAFSIEIESVENNLFPGATVLGPIAFAHTGNIEKAVNLDKIVIEYLKNI